MKGGGSDGENGSWVSDRPASRRLMKGSHRPPSDGEAMEEEHGPSSPSALSLALAHLI